MSEFKKAGHNAVGIVCHVGKPEDRTNLINKTVEKLGKIDYIVANAAVSTHMGSLFDIDENQLKKMWEINYFSTFFLIQEALPHLKKQPNSSIVLISSYTAFDVSTVIGHYSVTKTAMLGLTKALAKALFDDKIRVNVVCPGLIKTNFSGVLWKDNE